MFVELVTIVVDDYDVAIVFFVDVLGFELVENSPSLTNDGRAKRWVVVRPPGATTGILLTRADGPAQEAAVGEQVAVEWASSCELKTSAPRINALPQAK